MGEALFDLERLLLSKQPKQEKITAAEVKVLSLCKSKALKDFTIGGAVASGIVWAATWKLSRFIRVNIAGGTAACCGLWTFSKSLDSCVDHILGLDGTRMQTELANIIAQNYRDDAVKMKLVSKYFYTEKVFDSSTSDRPNLRLRHRSFFNEDLSLRGKISDSDDYGDHSDQSTDEKDPSSNMHQHKSLKVTSSKNSGGLKETRSEVKISAVNSAGGLPEILEDPLALVFGTSTATGEIHHQTAPSTNSSSSSRSHSRRSHRRRRRRHHELEDDPLD